MDQQSSGSPPRSPSTINGQPSTASKAVLDYLVRAESRQLEPLDRSRRQRRLGAEAHDLARPDSRARGARLALYRRVHRLEGRAREVAHVDRDLRAPAVGDEESERLDRRESAV